MSNRHSTVSEVRPEAGGFGLAFRHEGLLVGLYTPVDEDQQRPHDQDEVYVVVNGSGRFRNGDSCHDFGPGDVMFVPAGVEHRFEDFTEDLQTWVIFYGPTFGSGAA